MSKQGVSTSQRLHELRSTRKDARFVANHLPAPRPGLSFTIHGLEALCLYVQKHNLVVHFRGDFLICEPRPLDNVPAEACKKKEG